MFTPFDAGTIILLGCFVLVWYRFAVLASGRSILLLILAIASTTAVRIAGSAATALDVTAAWLLAYTAAAVGRSVIAKRVWPAQAFVIALALVTATGAYLRAYRLDE